MTRVATFMVPSTVLFLSTSVGESDYVSLHSMRSTFDSQCFVSASLVHCHDVSHVRGRRSIAICSLRMSVVDHVDQGNPVWRTPKSRLQVRNLNHQRRNVADGLFVRPLPHRWVDVSLHKMARPRSILADIPQRSAVSKDEKHR